MIVEFVMEKDGIQTQHCFLDADRVIINENFLEIARSAEDGWHFQYRFSNYKLERRGYNKVVDGDNRWNDNLGLITDLIIGGKFESLQKIFGDHQP